MEPDNDKNPQPKAFINTSVDIICGSAAKIVYAIHLAHSRRAGIDQEAMIKPVVFDFDDKIPPALLSCLDLDGEGIIPTDCWVPAVLPKKGFLQEPENQRLLVRLPRDWHRNPGLSSDNKGASSNPCLGYTYAQLNAAELTTKLQNRLRQAQDHNRRYQTLLKGTAADSLHCRITVNVYASLVGGMGSGSLFALINDIIPRCVRQDSTEVKVVLHLLVRGSLSIHDMEQAGINTYAGIKYLEALGTGALVDAESGRLLPVPFDMIYVYSNVNGHGLITTLEAFLSHLGHTKFFYFNSPGGQSLQARENDIGSLGYDQYESPQAVYTLATAALGRDSERETRFLTCLTAAAFADRLLAEGDLEKIITHSAELARHIHLVESDEENQITRPLSRPPALAGENIFERAQAALNDRMENTTGLPQAQALLDAVNIITGDDLQTIYAPAIREQAQGNHALAAEKIESAVKRLMHNESGLWESGKLLGSLKLTAEASHTSLSEKTAALTEQIAAQQAVLAEAEEQLEHIRHQSRLRRIVSFFYHFFMIRRIVAILQQSAGALIRFTLEQQLCHIAIEHFLEPLQDYLDHKISWISSTGPKLLQVAGHLKNQAAGIMTADTLGQTPVGFQFTTPEYLAGSFGHLVNRHGGAEHFPSYLIDIFLQKYGSLEMLVESPATEITDTLRALYRGTTEPVVKERSVSQILRKLPPGKQKGFFANLVTESAGRLPVDGKKPWIKAANVPAESDVAWAREMLDSVDLKAGKWEIAVHHDPDNIIIAQLTGGYGFEVILNDLDIPDTPAVRKKIMEKAVEPATALFVDPNPTVRDFQRVLAKAIASELLTLDQEGNFSLKWFTGESIDLGGDFATVHQKLQPKFRQLVFIESTFTRDLVVDEATILARLKQLLTRLSSSPADPDKRLALISAESVTQCQLEAEMLLPRLRRLAKLKRMP